MDLGLAGQAALVTGASSGIGYALCAALAREGALVVGAARREVAGLADTVTSVQADLAEPGGPAAAVEETVRRHGRLDILVNNVGIGHLHEGFLATSDEAWMETFNLNVMAAVRAIRAAIPYLLERGGVIANVSSINGHAPVPGLVDYSASKAALASMAKAVSKEYAGRGVRVVTVSPGPTATPMWLGPHGAAAQISAMTGADPRTIVAEAESEIPIGRFSTAGEVAAAIAFLVSPRAAPITGVDLLIDGGLTDTT